MREKTQGQISEDQFLLGIRHAEQVFLRVWAQLEAQKRKTESQPGYFSHSELGVQVVKRMPEQKLGRYLNETKQKREVIYAKSLRKGLRNEAKRFANLSHEKG